MPRLLAALFLLLTSTGWAEGARNITWDALSGTKIYGSANHEPILVYQGTVREGCLVSADEKPIEPDGSRFFRWNVRLRGPKGEASLILDCDFGHRFETKLAYEWTKPAPFFGVKIQDPARQDEQPLVLESARTVPSAEYIKLQLTESDSYLPGAVAVGWRILAAGITYLYSDANHYSFSPRVEWQPTWMLTPRDFVIARLGLTAVVDTSVYYPLISLQGGYRRPFGAWSLGADLGYYKFLGLADGGPVITGFAGYRMPLRFRNEIGVSVGSLFRSFTALLVDLQLRFAF